MDLTVQTFTDSILKLLPAGAAWNWQDCFGTSIVAATAAELVRVTNEANAIISQAFVKHTPKQLDITLNGHRTVANNAVAEIVEPPRKTFAVGSRVGQRLWSTRLNRLNFSVPLVTVTAAKKITVGSTVGSRLWSSPAVLVVRYYQSVVKPDLVYQALKQHKQAHVLLWLEDITGIGAHYA